MCQLHLHLAAWRPRWGCRRSNFDIFSPAGKPHFNRPVYPPIYRIVRHALKESVLAEMSWLSLVAIVGLGILRRAEQVQVRRRQH